MAETKPTKTGAWATAAGRTIEPSSGQATTGWELSEKPPARISNFLHNTAYTWFNWLTERLFDGSTSASFKIKAPESPGTLDLEGYDGSGAVGGDATVRGGTTDTANTDGGEGAVSGGTSKGSGSSVAAIKAATSGGAGSTDRVPESYAEADGGIERFNLLKALRAFVSGSDPSTPSVGDQYVRDDGAGAGGKPRTYNGSGWDRSVMQSFANLAASSPVVNTASEVMFDQNYTIPADTLRPGSTIRVRAFGRVTSTTGTPTLTIKLNVGGLSGNEVMSQVQGTPLSTHNWYVDWIGTVLDDGASGDLVGSGTILIDALTNPPVLDTGIFPNLIDTTASQQVGVSAEWSVADVNNSVQLEQIVVDVL
jgi:hypothetical protein